MGARLLAVNDADGTICNPNGIDAGELMKYVNENPKNLKRSVLGFPGAQVISKADFWEVPGRHRGARRAGRRDHRRDRRDD